MRKVMLRSVLVLVIANLGVLAVGRRLQADGLGHFEARGRITAVHDDFDLLEGAIQDGDGFVLFAPYNPESKLASRSGTTARYLQRGRGMKVIVADRVFSTTGDQPLEFSVLNGRRADSLVAKGTLQIPDDLSAIVWHKHSVRLMMLDRSGAALDGTDLPTQLALKDWSRTSFRISFVRSARFRMGRLFPAVSVIVDGVVEDIRLSTAPPFRTSKGV